MLGHLNLRLSITNALWHAFSSISPVAIFVFFLFGDADVLLFSDCDLTKLIMSFQGVVLASAPEGKLQAKRSSIPSPHTVDELSIELAKKHVSYMCRKRREIMNGETSKMCTIIIINI